MSPAGKGGRLVGTLVRAAKNVLSNPSARRIVARGAQETIRSFSGNAHDRQISRGGGRPTTRHAKSARSVAHHLVYSPDLDGKADPGEIVWTWVEFEEDPSEGKDRPVLVVGRDRDTLLGLMLSSQSRRRDDSNWEYLGRGSWDSQHRESYVRLDRVLEVPEAGIRREGSVLDRERFEQVARRLRDEYGWS
ncbi:type II toxin-antitoxin system PemK/MazF family toxin [uncultured Lawsonella sp.]|uniref:type II toxin-antitoxin system PemK/MazF family toxin n=1 Tax=uncultured Lawsonella sp. TaxID=1847727 RepID=UPI0026360840|nr:type II toxin-antitoxin system PemK/MazF family toxin [uncultured Lawsonella sp.]